jgi:hypothetical protein
MSQTSRESINLIQIDVKENGVLKYPKYSLYNSVLCQCITTVVSTFLVLPLNVVLLSLSFSDNWLTGFVLVKHSMIDSKLVTHLDFDLHYYFDGLVFDNFSLLFKFR